MANEQQVVDVIRKAVAAAGSQRQLAKEKGITVAYLNDILHGRRKVSANVAEMFGYEMTFKKIVEYRRKAWQRRLPQQRSAQRSPATSG